MLGYQEVGKYHQKQSLHELHLDGILDISQVAYRVILIAVEGKPW